MRWLRAIILLLITIGLVWLLDTPHGKLPALGKLLDPVNGWAANAEPANNYASISFDIKGLQQAVSVSLEERLVPHIAAANDHDLYFAQGYIHASFRLWQMDMQARAAAGRISEVAGARAVFFDDAQRRKGMVYAAERSLQAMEAEPHTKQMLDAYTAGVNAYIQSLNYKKLPLEYKLMGFKPEPWTNLKCALLLKYMADDLTGYTEDFPLTWLRDRLTPRDMDMLYPEKIPGTDPVIPRGTQFSTPSLEVPAGPGDSIFVHFSNGARDAVANFFAVKDDYEKDIGSNNWAVSGALSASGVPILCNDPHLGLNLPSLWFEVQLTAPGINAYGVSLPGAPGIVIGFNENISWGFTNNYRDVKDFYKIERADADHYWFNREKKAYIKRLEKIVVKDSASFTDTVLYTIHGPVIYDRLHPDPAKTGDEYALCWMAHRPTNELLALYGMNRAQGYEAFVQAITHFQCPAQNMVYADRMGNIAMWCQGQFINKWKEQGRYVMEGHDSLTLWGQDIPMSENPHVLNPPQGYVASANQSVTDSTYPYWYNGFFSEFRSWEINNMLRNEPGVKKWTAGDMMKMQNSTASILAARIYNALYFVDSLHLSASGREYLDSLYRWDGVLAKGSATASLFQVWWYFLYDALWKDAFGQMPAKLYPPAEISSGPLNFDTSAWCNNEKTIADRAIPGMRNSFCSLVLFPGYQGDKAARTYDDLRVIVSHSFQQACDSIAQLKKTVGTEWYFVKNTSVTHLAKIPAFSYDHLKIGGWGNTINACKQNHGPSWRMIVEMGKDSVRAYGVYPGGQSGNPGSKYYATMLDSWVEGRYYDLLFLPANEKQQDSRIKYKWSLKPMQ